MAIKGVSSLADMDNAVLYLTVLHVLLIHYNKLLSQQEF